MTDDIARWLEGLGLGQYASVFEENDIDIEVLPDLDDADLEKLGLSMGHRKRLLRAITEHAGGSGPDAESPPEPPTPTLASTEAERRQLTVMFCDLVGSTALSSRLGPVVVGDIVGEGASREAAITCAS